MMTWQAQLRAARTRGGAAPWTPPQLANLVGAWVYGLSGAVAQGGQWAGQYGTSIAQQLRGTATVGADGLTTVAGTNNSDATMPDPTSPTHLPWSFAAWIKTAATANALASLDGGNTSRPHFYLSAAASGNWYVANEFRGTAAVASTWTHIAVTRETAASYWWLYRIYRNGLQAATWTGNSGYTGSVLRLLGGYGNSSGGNLDCAYWWHNLCLSGDDVTALYAADPYRRGNL